MSTRKPTWDWKARDCAEISAFDVPFAVKEYLQNQVGQILKEKRTRKWADWNREDLRGANYLERRDCKDRLVTTFPGLLTGPHGAHLKKNKDWEPIFVLSGTVPWAELTTIYKTDLKICVVVWKQSSGSNLNGLSFYNNHLDAHARFSHFVEDGATTSRRNNFAVGEKGKGFILATQYLIERIEKNMCDQHGEADLEAKKWKPKVSFRVGHQIGEFAWRGNRDGEYEQLLRVSKDDLSPVDVHEFIRRRAPDKQDSYDIAKASRSLELVYERRFKQQLSLKKPGIAKASLPSHEESLVSADEVCITILELDDDLEPEYLFSAIFGIVEPPQTWSIPGTQFQLSKPFNEKPIFYHREQLVPSGMSLSTLSVNYDGNLDITSDRMAILRNGLRWDEYREELGKAADMAFRTMPDLAIELAREILTDGDEGYCSITFELNPADKLDADAYRAAFITAWRNLDPSLPADKTIYPSSDNQQDISLITELGMVPLVIRSSRIRELLEAAGAYKDAKSYADSLLIATQRSAELLPGLPRLQQAISSLLPSVHPSSVVLRDYRFSYPKVKWDSTSGSFAVGIPDNCNEHPEGGCLCWLGPCLSSAIKSWTLAKPEGIDEPSQSAIWRAYLKCMEGVVGMKEPPVEPIVEPNVDGMDSVVDDPAAMDDGSIDSDDENEPLNSPGRSCAKQDIGSFPSTYRHDDDVSGMPEPSEASGRASATPSLPTAARVPHSVSSQGGSSASVFTPATAAPAVPLPTQGPSASSSSSAPLVIPADHPLVVNLRSLQLAFEQEVRNAHDGANARTATLQDQLVEAQTQIARRQSLIRAREMEVATVQKQLVEQRSTIKELQDAMVPLNSIFDKLGRGGEGSNKRRRED